MPVQIVRLDTVESREQAANGKFFSVTSVPTMVVVYADGNIQMFVGVEKILAWLKRSTRPPSARPTPRVQPDEVVSIIEDDTSSEEETPVPVKPRKKTKKSTKKTQPSKKSKTPKKSKKVVTFEDSGDEEDVPDIDPIEIEFVDDGRPRRPPPPPTDGLIVGPRAKMGKKSSMQTLKEQAQRMAKDREQTLGYREEDLPRSL